MYDVVSEAQKHKMMFPRQGRGVEIQLWAHVQTSVLAQSDRKGSEKDKTQALSKEYTLAIFRFKLEFYTWFIGFRAL